MECSAADELKYVLGIYADLEYSIGGKDIVLKVRDTTLALVVDDKKVCFGNNGIEEFNGFEDYTNASEQKIFELTSSFFYTIVTNYSVQAYVASDYSEEKCLVYDRKKSVGRKTRELG